MKSKNMLIGIVVASATALSTFSCSEKVADEIVSDVLEKESEETESNSNCLSDKDLSLAARTLMANSYEFVWKHSNPGSQMPTSEKVKQFSYVNINKLITLPFLSQQSTGIRAYFGYADDSNDLSKSPEILLVNTVGCDSQLDPDMNCVLVSGDSSTSRMISIQEAASMTENWRNAMEANRTSTDQNNWMYRTVNSYNFEIDNFDNNGSGNNVQLEYVPFAFTMKLDELGVDPINNLNGTLQIGLMICDLENDGFNSILRSVDLAFPCPNDCGAPNPLESN